MLQIQQFKVINDKADKRRVAQPCLRYAGSCAPIPVCSDLSARQLTFMFVVPFGNAPALLIPALPFEPALDQQTLFIGMAVLGGAIFLTLILLVIIMAGTRLTVQRTIATQELLLHQQRTKEMTAALQPPHGWQSVAEQLVADALRESIGINTDIGVMDVTSQPNPRFTLLTRDGRSVSFTTDLQLMKKAHLVRRGDRVVNVSHVSPTSHTEATLLWQSLLAQRNMQTVTPASSMHWYVVVRPTGQRVGAARWGQR